MLRLILAMMVLINSCQFPLKKSKVWKQVRKPVQLEGGIDDGYELVDE